MSSLRRWWWPVYAFVFPLLIWPNPMHMLADNFELRAWWTLLALAGGFLLEWAAHPDARLTAVPAAIRGLGRNPALGVALAYGTWTIVASLFSPNPAVALTGSLMDYGDGALWTGVLCLVFVLVYLQRQRDPGLGTRIVGAVIAAGVLTAALAVVEVLGHRAFIATNAAASSLPIVTFDGRGHLAGFMVLVAGAACGLWRQGVKSALPALGAAALAVGLSFNRASAVAIGLAALAAARPWHRGRVAAAVALAGFAGGWGIVQLAETGGARAFGDNLTARTRTLLWQSAAGGIAARPLVGWGGDQFVNHWFEFLSPSDLSRFLQLEEGYRRLVRVVGAGTASPAFLAENAQGEVGLLTYRSWKAHNQFLDVALMWGLVGLAAYLALLTLGIRAFDPAGIALLAYHAFLLLWFVPFHVEGTMWALWGAAAAAWPLRKAATDRTTQTIRAASEPAGHLLPEGVSRAQ